MKLHLTTSGRIVKKKVKESISETRVSTLARTYVSSFIVGHFTDCRLLRHHTRHNMRSVDTVRSWQTTRDHPVNSITRDFQKFQSGRQVAVRKVGTAD
jgi:hypothetical protein